MTRGAIVVGASSGIGEALARELAEEGYELGLTARRTEKLKAIGAELPTKSYVATMDVTDTEDARAGFFELAEAMESVDLVVANAGIGVVNRDLEWGPEHDTIETNVSGFVAVATAALEYFEANPTPEDEPDGHLVGVSSVAAHLGNGAIPAYNASKAFVSRYLEGLRYRQAGRDAAVTITTIEPGYVDTKLTMGEFWKASPEKAATQIARAIRRRERHAYITRRWRLVAWVVKLLPEFVLRRLFA
ncbi:SDR family NAD(P)-dependent oxidoreductase [Halostagnicola bangensis]